MAGAITVYKEKNILEIPLKLSFHSIPSKFELWKVGKMQSFFPKEQFFFHTREILTSQ